MPATSVAARPAERVTSRISSRGVSHRSIVSAPETYQPTQSRTSILSTHRFTPKSIPPEILRVNHASAGQRPAQPAPLQYVGVRLAVPSVTTFGPEAGTDVLTQLSTLVALGVTTPQDPDAVKIWLDGNADRDHPWGTKPAGGTVGSGTKRENQHLHPRTSLDCDRVGYPLPSAERS